MNINKMHMVFRQYSQQMGLQNVRAILPEQIDILINTSISDTVNSILREIVGVNDGRVLTEGNRLNKINALRTLYKVDKINLITGNNGVKPFTLDMSNKSVGKYISNDTFFSTYSNNVRFWIDFSINYTVANSGWRINPSDGSIIYPVRNDIVNETTKTFPVRIVDDIFLTDTINDNLLRNRLTSPIITLYDGTSSNTIVPKFEIYIDKFDKDLGLLENSLVPYELRVSYIKKPAVVKLGVINNETSTDCDLPEHLHEDIIKHAVDLYRVAVSNSLYQNSNN